MRTILIEAGVGLVLAAIALRALRLEWRTWQHWRKMCRTTERAQSMLRRLAARMEYAISTTVGRNEHDQYTAILSSTPREHLESMLSTAAMAMTTALKNQRHLYDAMFQSMLGCSLEERRPAYLRGMARAIWRHWLMTDWNQPGLRTLDQFEAIEDTHVQCLALELIAEEAMSTVNPTK